MRFLFYKVMLVVILVVSVYNANMIEHVQAGKMHVDELRVEIEKAAAKNNASPINAKIDPVWKLMPGLEGRTIDEEASLLAMEKRGVFSNNKLVYKVSPPKVSIHSLPAAPIYRGLDEKRMVAFTINVAWGEEYLVKILEVLEKHKIHATFFLEGKWTEKNPEIAKMLVDKGHEVGNHSYSHADMKEISSSQIEEELDKTNIAIKKATGKIVKIFAPPSGSYRDETISIAKEKGMFTTLWTVDTIDWQKPEPSLIVKRIQKKLHSGAIVLMHPTKPTAQALEECITYIHSKGLKIGTVSELISEKRK